MSNLQVLALGDVRVEVAQAAVPAGVGPRLVEIDVHSGMAQLRMATIAAHYSFLLTQRLH